MAYELIARSETVREDERTRIAREVHDELGSLLLALKTGAAQRLGRPRHAQAHAV